MAIIVLQLFLQSGAPCSNSDGYDPFCSSSKDYCQLGFAESFMKPHCQGTCLNYCSPGN